ncbi:MAG TPA: peptidylprolyl isomerase [Kofleriaceae bacterium]|nr:peptidylprolyl isomerase [Kofleriaceae bacterium]
MMFRVLALATMLAVPAFAAGCGGQTPAAPTPAKPATAAAPAESSVISADILAREPVANTAVVKHILISWSDLADNFGGHLDPRAAKRTKADAEAEVRSLLKQLKDGADFDTLMKASSEDTGSASSGHAFTVTPDAQLVIEFRQLSLRLNVGEYGVVQSDFGFHIIKRFS